jgi:serine/threonine-protein kinase
MNGKPTTGQITRIAPEAKDLEEIDSGGFKVVYKATIGNQIEALKLAYIPSDPTDSSLRDENTRRIYREINILRQCNNPYLVKLGSISPRPCTIGKHDYVLYSEEFIEGDSLRRLISNKYQPSSEEIINLGTCLLKAVSDLASKKIIHRDIKPANVIKTPYPKRPYLLLDLGIAFQLGGTQLTRDSLSVPGTLYYIAPEMLDPGFRQNLDHRADLYTIGLTIYEFASGNNPYAHRSDPQFTTLYRIKTEKPQPLHELRTDLPVALCHLVDQLMKKVPALRPANIKSLIKRMETLS